MQTLFGMFCAYIKRLGLVAAITGGAACSCTAPQASSRPPETDLAGADANVDAVHRVIASLGLTTGAGLTKTGSRLYEEMGRGLERGTQHFEDKREEIKGLADHRSQDLVRLHFRGERGRFVDFAFWQHTPNAPLDVVKPTAEPEERNAVYCPDRQGDCERVPHYPEAELSTLRRHLTCRAKRPNDPVRARSECPVPRAKHFLVCRSDWRADPYRAQLDCWYPPAVSTEGPPTTRPTSSPIVSSPFNPRRTIHGRSSPHYGYDLASLYPQYVRFSVVGQPLYAARDGYISVASDVGGNCGVMVQIEHDDGVTTKYCHASELADWVAEERPSPGNKVPVRRGEIVAYLGKTGTRHAHLHFEVIRHGRHEDPLRKFLKYVPHTLPKDWLQARSEQDIPY